ncbi:flagellar basal-body MS-ring/collar protein FliF [Malikia sp.]|uniref:flagellar basal-body MS-ring/collar protein FliF n=1 Tax=Malikia sp. TaxID=2070706 RepID=UPI0026155D1D|nr:flagellar basal-body MS-ring/collar protein FliF [Malikia sp.]MDD2727882.1 flagellar basal-body MS-ring/collar protein FliF [Malikia sp.]
MATESEARTNGFMEFFKSALGRNLAAGAGIAMVLALMAAIWMWNQKPAYKVLLTNFSDRDGGAIIAALQQMNIPYQFAEGGGAILVPAERVHDTRLKLASQGLPKGGNVGFELMENQKLGVSQFLEQVNFQRALEGELARSINSIAMVQSARVHLAIPKPSVFVRDKQQPTAAVMVNLYPGRTLDAQQVSSIIHLVSSSVPELTAKNVTVVDQNGLLLSSPENRRANTQLDPSQLKYVQDLQDAIVKRIESILTPVVGNGNVRAEATAEVDFSRVEQAAESYKPNSPPEVSAIRSQRSNESSSSEPKPGGVPGAAANQPGGTATPSASANSAQKESTVNYELDKTISYTQQAMGGIKRLNVAVVVNHKREVGADGKVTTRPLTDQEKTQITDLIKEAMGYNQQRGDSLNVMNSAFAETLQEAVPEEPFWKPFATLEFAKSAVQYLLSLLVLGYLYFKLLRPMVKQLNPEPPKPPEPPPEPIAAAPTEQPTVYEASTESANRAEPAIPRKTRQEIEAEEEEKEQVYRSNLQAAKAMTMKDPKMVADIVRGWMNDE